MAELREHVLKFLDMKTLRTLMCVKQRVMSDVANLVWHSVWHEQVTALASIPEVSRSVCRLHYLQDPPSMSTILTQSEATADLCPGGSRSRNFNFRCT